MKLLAFLAILLVFPGATVLGLHRVVSPSAVLGAVVPIVVNPVYFKADNVARVHVSNEILKGMPALADRDSASAIVLKALTFGTIATVMNHPPSSIQGVGIHTVFGDGIQLSAPTASNAATYQAIDSREVRELTADTFADSDVAISSDPLSDDFDSQPAKRLAYFKASGREGLESEFGKVHGFNQFGMTG